MSDVIYITALEQYEAVLWLCLACSDIQPESTVFPLYYCSAYVHVAVHLVCQSSVMLSHSPDPHFYGEYTVYKMEQF